jgi:hypothetical protein
MSKADWTYALLGAFCLYWVMTRLDRLGRQLEYTSNRIRREMAELQGKEKRTNELREEGDQEWKEHKKAARREEFGIFAFIGAIALWLWYSSQH